MNTESRGLLDHETVRAPKRANAVLVVLSDQQRDDYAMDFEPLEHAGVDFVYQSSADDALDGIVDLDPALVIVGMTTDTMDGLEFVAQLMRRYPKFDRKVVALPEKQDPFPPMIQWYDAARGRSSTEESSLAGVLDLVRSLAPASVPQAAAGVPEPLGPATKKQTTLGLGSPAKAPAPALAPPAQPQGVASGASSKKTSLGLGGFVPPPEPLAPRAPAPSRPEPPAATAPIAPLRAIVLEGAPKASPAKAPEPAAKPDPVSSGAWPIAEPSPSAAEPPQALPEPPPAGQSGDPPAPAAPEWQPPPWQSAQGFGAAAPEPAPIWRPEAAPSKSARRVPLLVAAGALAVLLLGTLAVLFVLSASKDKARPDSEKVERRAAPTDSPAPKQADAPPAPRPAVESAPGAKPAQALPNLEQLSTMPLTFERASEAYTVSDPAESDRLVSALREGLKKDGAARIEAGGHASEEGQARFNWEIGLRRAAALRSYLEKQGIERDRIVLKSYGTTKPLHPSEPENNRRVTVRLIR